MHNHTFMFTGISASSSYDHIVGELIGPGDTAVQFYERLQYSFKIVRPDDHQAFSVVHYNHPGNVAINLPSHQINAEGISIWTKHHPVIFLGTCNSDDRGELDVIRNLTYYAPTSTGFVDLNTGNVYQGEFKTLTICAFSRIGSSDVIIASINDRFVVVSGGFDWTDDQGNFFKYQLQSDISLHDEFVALAAASGTVIDDKIILDVDDNGKGLLIPGDNPDSHIITYTPDRKLEYFQAAQLWVEGHGCTASVTPVGTIRVTSKQVSAITIGVGGRGRGSRLLQRTYIIIPRNT